MTSSKDYDLISLEPSISPAYQGVANCFSKGPDSKYLSFAYPVVSVTTTQLCPCLEAAFGNEYGTIPVHLHLLKQVWGHSLLTSVLFFFLIQFLSRKFHLGDDIQHRLHLIRAIYIL